MSDTKHETKAPSPVRSQKAAASLIIALIWVWWLWTQLPYISSDDNLVSTTSRPVVVTPRRERPLIVYAYSESETARGNLEFFSQKGIHGAADFIFIFSGETNATSLVPDLPNVRSVKRPDTCHDLGAIGEVLKEGNLWKKYSKFITMSANVRGPFLPNWSAGCWTDIFLDRVTDTVKLVGTNIGCHPRPHIRSKLFATDQVGMFNLLDPTLGAFASMADEYGSENDPVGLSGCYETSNAAVHAEIGSTGLIVGAGYEVDALVTSMDSQHSIEEFCAANSRLRELRWDDAYLHPYETVFFDMGRQIDNNVLGALTERHIRMQRSSFETCL